MNNDMQKTYILTTASLNEFCLSKSKSNVKDIGRIPKVAQLENQKDLMKMVSVLLSTGTNKNDDVFIASEILPIRNTGAHKPVNFEHRPEDIIGHIIRTFAAEKNGKIVPDGQKPQGKDFDIVAESVIYKFLLPDIAEEIKQKAKNGELFVSVEVWFNDFDFLVGSRFVKRTSETAGILEPKLRINGGSGFFEGQKLSRVLRKMIIGGMGVVSDPANPDSIIKSIASFNSQVVKNIEDKIISANVLEEKLYFDESAKNNEIEIVIQQEEKMDGVNNEILEEMTAVAAAIHAASEENKIEKTEEDQTVASKVENEEFKALAARIEALEKDNKDLKAKNAEAEQKAEATRRESRLISAGVTDPKDIQNQLGLCFHMTKEQFNNHVDGIISLFKSRFSAESSTQTIEETSRGGDNVSADDTEVVAENVQKINQNDSDDYDGASVEADLEVEIEAVDPDINTQTSAPNKKDVSDVAIEILKQFLVPNDKKWENLG